MDIRHVMGLWGDGFDGYLVLLDTMPSRALYGHARKG
jgi:hypothetical protein